MTNKPLLVSDFDGVIIDGINEYWSSSRQACENIFSKQKNPIALPIDLPESFKKLRPWVHYGWEMVLLAAESARPTSQLNSLGWKNFAKNYKKECAKSLNVWGWEPFELQEALDNARKEAISNDLPLWLTGHKPFPEVIKRLQKLEAEEIELVILTTKSIEFTKHLLNSYKINAALIFGHESGSKTNILNQLVKHRIIKGFIEDRRSTLEEVLKEPLLSPISFYLADWGYLKPEDLTELPLGINLLGLKKFKEPIENWP